MKKNKQKMKKDNYKKLIDFKIKLVSIKFGNVF